MTHKIKHLIFSFFCIVLLGGLSACNDHSIDSSSAIVSPFKSLYSFFPQYPAGNYPAGDLVLSDGVLYGTTENGGASDSGTIFKVGIDGSNLTALHSFTGGNDGANPVGSVIISNNTLYGMASAGGSSNYGTIFSINTDGTNFTTLHSFAGGSGSQNPAGNLLLVGNILYGMTAGQSGQDNGKIFSLDITNPASPVFTILYAFNPTTDGSAPRGSLILSNNVLYGTTNRDGLHLEGTIFSLDISNPSSPVFSTLFSFTSTTGYPTSNSHLVISNNTLYGMTVQGGTNHRGSIFSFDIDNSTYATLYSFPTSNGGKYPAGSLLLSDNVLYGATGSGGANSEGAVFALDISGSPSMSILYSFTNANDGSSPTGSLLLFNGLLYGTTSLGATANGGTVFSVSTSGTFTTLQNFPGAPTGNNPSGNLVFSGNKFYGTTVYGGVDGGGTIFSVNPDGSDLNIVHNFTLIDVAGNGAIPVSSLLLSGTTLYGTTFRNRADEAGYGTIYSLDITNPDSPVFNHLYTFTDGNDGAYPFGNLINSGNTLYGTTFNAGAHGYGTIYSLDVTNPGSPTFTTLYSFANSSDGAQPETGMLLSDNVLYGTTEGFSGFGTVYSLNITNPNSPVFTLLYAFSGGSDGAYPGGDLLLSNNVLYGTTNAGGSSSVGTIFSLDITNPNTPIFNTLHTFTGDPDGAYPEDSHLVLIGNTLYGETSQGGSGSGTLFSVNIDGSNYNRLYSFSGSSDGINPNSLIVHNNSLYGLAGQGGSNAGGTIFSYGPL